MSCPAIAKIRVRPGHDVRSGAPWSQARGQAAARPDARAIPLRLFHTSQATFLSSPPGIRKLGRAFIRGAARPFSGSKSQVAFSSAVRHCQQTNRARATSILRNPRPISFIYVFVFEAVMRVSDAWPKTHACKRPLHDLKASATRIVEQVSFQCPR